MNPRLNDAIIDSRPQWDIIDRLTKREPLGIFFEHSRREVQRLYIFGPESDEITTDRQGCYTDETGTWVLLAGVKAKDVQHCLNCCSHALRELWIEGSNVTSVALSPFTGLQKLVIRWTRIGQMELEQPLPALEFFEYTKGPLNVKTVLHQFPGLRQLELRWCSLGGMSDLRSFAHLQELNILQVTNLEVGAFLLPTLLERIYITDMQFHHLPESILQLKNLEGLNIWNCRLEELPLWLPDLGLDMSNGFDASVSFLGTTIEGVDMSIFYQPQEAILQWFEEERQGRMKALNEAKVIFLGDGGVGKTLTIARLMKDGKRIRRYKEDPTPGVLIRHQNYTLGDRQVRVHFWDFGGQEVMHPMHRMFLSKRTLYVVMVNARNGNLDSQARVWLHNVASFAGDCPVLVVLNQIDENRNAGLDLPGLQKDFPALKGVVRLSALKNSKEEFNQSFTRVLLHEIAGMKVLDERFVDSWRRVKDFLETMETNYINEQRFEELCREMQVEAPEESRDVILDTILKLLNDIGACIRYCQNQDLQEYIVLKPEWIFNAVYTILFNKHPNMNNGILKHSDILSMIQPDSGFRMTKKIKYRPTEFRYIMGVIRQFGLSVDLKDEREFIPMLCGTDAVPLAKAYADAPDALEFQMEFPYLPDNVIHRLMAELHKDLDIEQVWRFGAKFDQRSSGLSAMVMKAGNHLNFYVRGGTELHRAHTYLCELKDAVEGIVSDMGLAAPKCIVIYKENQQQDEFDYQTLIVAKKCQIESFFSPKFMRNLRIDDILNQSSDPVEREREALLERIVKGCHNLQANPQYWFFNEDQRTHEIAECLRHNYQVEEQKAQGRSPAGKGPGKVDLEIRRKNVDMPWTMLEALRVKSKNDTELSNWDDHLLKLLKNYNVHGVDFAILLSYLDHSERASYSAVCRELLRHNAGFSKDGFAVKNIQEIHLDPKKCPPLQYIQMHKSRYEWEDGYCNVYHIFVRMGA